MKRFFGVKKGYTTGIFTNYEKVKESVHGFSGAEYRGFTTRKEAATSVGCNPASTTGINEAIKNKKLYKGFYWELESQ
jgi:ribonuclease HI